MSLDARIREGLTMIDKTLPEVDARAGLDDLHREIARDTRRRRVAIIAAAAAVLIAAPVGKR